MGNYKRNWQTSEGTENNNKKFFFTAKPLMIYSSREVKNLTKDEYLKMFPHNFVNVTYCNKKTWAWFLQNGAIKIMYRTKNSWNAFKKWFESQCITLCLLLYNCYTYSSDISLEQKIKQYNKTLGKCLVGFDKLTCSNVLAVWWTGWGNNIR